MWLQTLVSGSVYFYGISGGCSGGGVCVYLFSREGGTNFFGDHRVSII